MRLARFRMGAQTAWRLAGEAESKKLDARMREHSPERRKARTYERPDRAAPWREKHRRTEAGGVSKREGHPPRRPPASLSWGRQHLLAAPFRLDAARRGRTGSSWSAWRAPSARANNNARGPVARTAAALPLLVPAPASEVHVRGTPHDCVQCSAGGRAGASSQTNTMQQTANSER